MDINKIIKQKKCNICHDSIGLYTPWYTIQVRGHFATVGDNKLTDTMVLCSSCFHAYEHFLMERMTQQNHYKNYLDMKGEK